MHFSLTAAAEASLAMPTKRSCRLCRCDRLIPVRDELADALLSYSCSRGVACDADQEVVPALPVRPSDSGSRRTRGCTSLLQLQVAINEVVLLQAAQTLADLARPDRTHSVDGLQVTLRGSDDPLETGKLADEAVDDVLRQPRDVREDAVAARRDGAVERIRRRRIPEHGEQLELEQVLVRDLGQRLQTLGNTV